MLENRLCGLMTMYILYFTKNKKVVLLLRKGW